MDPRGRRGRPRGLSDVGFGLFISASAVGGVLGSYAYPWLSARLGEAFLLRWGLVVEAGTYLALIATTDGLLAGAVMVLFGAHTMVWGTAAVTVRQRLTPEHVLGRVGSAYRLADLGGAALGGLAGGLLADGVDLLAPFWVAAAALGGLAVAAWKPLLITERS